MAARMRFCHEALAELRKDDPHTSITLNYVRQLAKTGKIPVHVIGRRRLINYDSLLAYLANPDEGQGDIQLGVIRHVLERPAMRKGL